MQLRVARLCLDCEELHVEDRCPVCASDQYAFLSSWLPSEERRRWRRAATRTAAIGQRPRRAFERAVRRWLGLRVDEPRESYRGPKTRASDRVPALDFDGPAEAPAPTPQPASAPLSHAHKR